MTFSSRVTLSILLVLALSLAAATARAENQRKSHLFVEVLDAKGILDTDWFNKPDPYVRVHVLDRKDNSPATCREGKYVIRDETYTPAWFATKMICREYPEDTSDLRLRVTLRDDDPIGYDDLGHADVPLSNVTMGEVMTLKVKKDTQTIRIRVREHFPKDLKKRIYLVREASKKYLDLGQRTEATKRRRPQGWRPSYWTFHTPIGYYSVPVGKNPSKDPASAYYDEDYPLNVKGRAQALTLAGYVNAVMNDTNLGTADEKAFVASRKAMSSPLASAVMTAVIALDPMMKPRGTLESGARLRLKQDARDRRKGDATKGKKIGDLIANRVLRYMSEFLFETIPLSMKETLKRLDLEEVRGRWWLNKDESDKALRSRLYEFFVEQMLWEDDDNVILVGHAKFFREFLQAQMQSELKDNIAACNQDHRHLPYCEKYGPYSLAQFWKYDMDHCAVLAVDLDYSSVVARLGDPEGASDDVKIVRDIGFLFGSGLWGVIPSIN